MFVIYMNAGKTKQDFYGCNDYADAVKIAESFDYEIVDFNGFSWWLSIEEEDGNADDFYSGWEV